MSQRICSRTWDSNGELRSLLSTCLCFINQGPERPGDVCVQELERTVKTQVLMSCVLSGFSEHGRKLVDCEFAAQDGSLLFLLSYFPSAAAAAASAFPGLWHQLGSGEPGAPLGRRLGVGVVTRDPVPLGNIHAPPLPSSLALIFPLSPEGCRSLWCGSLEPFPQGLIPQGWCGTQCHLGTHR